MSDYIKREDAVNAIGIRWGKRESPAKDIKRTIYRNLVAIPSADVAPIRHGEWKFDNETDSFFCSECNAEALLKCVVCGGCIQELSEYCPNCGAKMDEEKDDEL